VRNPQPTFKTQQECWAAVCAGAKLTIGDAGSGSSEYVHFVDGKLVRQDGKREYSGQFECPSDWRIWEQETITGWPAVYALQNGKRLKAVAPDLDTRSEFFVSNGRTYVRRADNRVESSCLALEYVLSNTWLEVSP
jgi:hypothetical protein